MASTMLGEAVIKLTFDGKDIKASLRQVETDVEKSGKSAGNKWGSAWAVAAGNLIAKGIGKMMSTVSSLMDGAIERIDIINNFPRVMQALGYSSEETEGSISLVSDALDGLPTTLDGAIADIQKLAASMDNLYQGEVNATTVGLGLNDMFLAGGKSTAVVSAAMEQYNQMLANNKVDMQSWKSLVNSAPGQMNQLARSILGANANQADLYKAMQKGIVTFDQFNAAVVKLDKEGGAGIASFYDQAVAATDNIQTQLLNVRSSINKIIGGIMQDNMDDVEKYTIQLTERIARVAPVLINGFTGAFAALTKALPGIFTSILPSLVDGMNQMVMGIFESLPLFAQAFVDGVPIVMEGLNSLFQALINAFPTVLPQFLLGITNGIIALATELTKPENLAMVLNAAITLLLSLVNAIPDILEALIDALPQIIENIVTFLTDPENIQKLIEGAIELFMALVMAVPQILGALIEAFGKLVGDAWNGIQQFFGDFANNFGTFIGDIFKGAINGLLSFIENFINGPIDLLNGFIGLINDAFGWLGVDIGYIDRIQLPRLAEGGVANGATAAIIGEEGREAVIPLEHNTDNWAGLLASTLATEMKKQDSTGGEINVYMTNQINNKLDAMEIGNIMIQSIRRAA